MITDESPSEKRSLKTLTMKRILSNNIDSALDSWTQCNYFMAKKNRFCNMAKSNNSNYCGNHRPIDETPPERVLKKMRKKSSTDQNKEPDLDVRIPCPIDPSHTIYKHNLDQHLKICNTKIRIEQLEKYDYYCKNCNTSGMIAGEVLSSDREEELNLENLILKIDKVFDDFVSPNIVDTLCNVNEISSRNVDTILNELVASQVNLFIRKLL
jgi:tRNA:m4X modification enzyme